MVPGGGAQWQSLLDMLTAELMNAMPGARHARTIPTQSDVCDVVVLAHDTDGLQPFVECVCRRQGENAVLEIRRFVRRKVRRAPIMGWCFVILAAGILAMVNLRVHRGSGIDVKVFFGAMFFFGLSGSAMVAGLPLKALSTNADSQSRALHEGVKHAAGSVAGRFQAAYGLSP